MSPKCTSWAETLNARAAIGKAKAQTCTDKAAMLMASVRCHPHRAACDFFPLLLNWKGLSSEFRDPREFIKREIKLSE